MYRPGTIAPPGRMPFTSGSGALHGNAALLTRRASSISPVTSVCMTCFTAVAVGPRMRVTELNSARTIRTSCASAVSAMYTTAPRCPLARTNSRDAAAMLVVCGEILAGAAQRPSGGESGAIARATHSAIGAPSSPCRGRSRTRANSPAGTSVASKVRGPVPAT